jgi:hypothetical protein
MMPLAGPPLYDGVVVFDPYKWLSPPPGLDGGAKSAQQTFSGGDLQGGFGFGTPEEPPQIQVQSVFASLAMPDGTSAVTMSIEPVATPSARPPNGIVAGNVYQISVTDQDGTAITPESGATVTLVLRGPTSLPEATIEQFAGGTWTELQTSWPGVPNTFVADIANFGEFALVAPEAWVPSGETAASASPVESASTAPVVSASAIGSVGEIASAQVVNAAPTSGKGSGLRLPAIIGIAFSAIVLILCLIWLAKPGRAPRPKA